MQHKPDKSNFSYTSMHVLTWCKQLSRCCHQVAGNNGDVVGLSLMDLQVLHEENDMPAWMALPPAQQIPLSVRETLECPTACVPFHWYLYMEHGLICTAITSVPQGAATHSELRCAARHVPPWDLG